MISEKEYYRYFEERLCKEGKNEDLGYEFPFTDN